MASHLTIRPRFQTLTLDLIRSISTSTVLSQHPQISDDHPPPQIPTPLPPNPAADHLTYRLNSTAASAAVSLIPSGFLHQAPANRIAQMSRSLDAKGVLNVFADMAALQKWDEIKGLFETWVGVLDKSTGKPNRADVEMWNSYLRACLMVGAITGELLDLVAQMEEVRIFPNTASFNLVLKVMFRARETEAAEKLLERKSMLPRYTEHLSSPEKRENTILDL